ncbi:MAG TPA: histidinol-phosphate transaminase [Gemmatimonadota bacterium]|nr:histidinol-phosphate transaminase [Gemmatimonadota bacterium]
MGRLTARERRAALETRPAASAATAPRADLERIWPYIPGRHRSEIAREFGVRDVLKLASNENPLGPSPKALAALTAHAAMAHEYPDSQSLELRAALTGRHDLAPEHFVVGNGSVECIDLVARAFLRPGDEAVVGFPSFPRFQIACQLVGVKATVVPHRDWRFDLAGLRRAVTERTRVVFLDDPCNPTGTSIPAEDLAALLDDLPPRTLVLLDRAYYEFIPPAERFAEDLDRIRDGANLVVLRTFSKAYGLAGLRVGYAITRPEHARAMNRVREAFNCGSLAQAAAVAALDDHAHVAETVAIITAERAWLGRELARLGFRTVPSITNFLFTDLGPRAGSINRALLERGIVVRPMSAPGIQSWARISISNRDGNLRLIGALEALVG